MAAARHLIDLFAAPLASPHVKQRTAEMQQVFRDLAEPVRHRLNAPLVGPPQFGTVREYRAWKEQRRARPDRRSALQWPLGVWLVIAVSVMFWLTSLVW